MTATRYNEDIMDRFHITVKILQFREETRKDIRKVAIVVERSCKFCFQTKEYPVDLSFGESKLYTFEDLPTVVQQLINGLNPPGIHFGSGYYSECTCKWSRLKTSSTS